MEFSGKSVTLDREVYRVVIWHVVQLSWAVIIFYVFVSV